MSRKAKLFIISAPSGCGKTTLCKRLLKGKLGLAYSVSMTTRPRRTGERNGRDYYFVSKAGFQKQVKRNGFLEWTKTYGWYYGTPKKNVSNLLKKGKDILLSIDVKGAVNVKRLYPKSILIFIAPPSIKELKGRLKKRNSDNKKEISKRLKIVKRELSYVDRYDYCVVNDSISNAVSKLKDIVIAERCRKG
ncbi:MAG: guanylate kinase [Candidatus Omnitrophica bacterium]|nr:guanylate kinase [Candidatus Omnitrophota bacterium]